jgi:two-component system sensor histidine kinase YesM
MNMLASLINAIRNSRLQTKLIISYIILITVPIVLFSVSYYKLGKDTIMDMAKKDAYTIVRKNNEIIDSKLSRVREMIIAFSEDPDFKTIFAGIDPGNREQILDADLRITKILNKYFAQSQDIYSVQLATTYFTFGQDSSSNSEHGKNFIPKGAFRESALFDAAYAGDGRIVWIPTYNFSEMFNVDYLRNTEIDYKYLLSAVCKINIPFPRNESAFNSSVENPVLIVNFKESLFTNVFTGSLPTEGSFYFVIDDSGRVISHRDQQWLTERVGWPDLRKVVTEKTGVDMLEIEGKQRVVSFDQSSITGWYTIAVIPPNELLDPIISTYIRNMLISAGVLTLLFIGLSSYLSGIITHPIRTMIRAILITGEGKFQVKFKEHGSFEFRVLMRKFNDMNDKIQKLIEENYGIKIREKEAEIKSLNLQLDPHFMHNTLNLISLISLEKGEDEISELITGLSYMMKYIVKKDNLVTFEEDFTYLKSYISIMTKRFEGKFTIEFDVDPVLLQTTVPKFFLQPIIENALIHGFERLDRKGKLSIKCYIEHHVRVFIVQDNGKGMTRDQVERLMNQNGGSVGLNNVYRRIQAIYGENYGVTVQSAPGEGTTVTVRMPLEIVKREEAG